MSHDFAMWLSGFSMGIWGVIAAYCAGGLWRGRRSARLPGGGYQPTQPGSRANPPQGSGPLPPSISSVGLFSVKCDCPACTARGFCQ